MFTLHPMLDSMQDGQIYGDLVILSPYLPVLSFSPYIIMKTFALFASAVYLPVLSLSPYRMMKTFASVPAPHTSPVVTFT